MLFADLQCWFIVKPEKNRRIKKTAGGVAESISFGIIFEFLGAVLWTIVTNKLIWNSMMIKNGGEGFNDILRCCGSESHTSGY